MLLQELLKAAITDSSCSQQPLLTLQSRQIERNLVSSSSYMFLGGSVFFPQQQVWKIWRFLLNTKLFFPGSAGNQRKEVWQNCGSNVRGFVGSRRHKATIIPSLSGTECHTTSDRKQSVTFKLETRGCWGSSAVFFHQIWGGCGIDTSFTGGEYEMPVCQLSSDLCCAMCYEEQTTLQSAHRDRLTFAAWFKCRN